MSNILSKISIFTGQISSQALHEVQAHNSSGVTLSNTLEVFTLRSIGVVTVAGTGGSPVSDITWPTLRIISLGSNGLPVKFAGHTEVHLPHTVQASKSTSCFQVKFSISSTPTLSISSNSIRLPMSFMAPFGRSFGLKYIFTGEVTMWRSLDWGRTIKNIKKEITWRIQEILWKVTPFSIGNNSAIK